jgi:hypothetical protein
VKAIVNLRIPQKAGFSVIKGSVVGLGTMLRAGRLRARFPMK